MQVMIGRAFGPYDVDDALGRGTVSNVYSVRTRSGERRALKVLTTLAMGSEEVRTGFEREYRLMRRIDHPNVPRAHRFGEFAGVLYLEMDLVEADTLADRLPPEVRLPEAEVVRIGASVARTLAAVHRAGIVHRDVKPSNILLPEGREPVLFDFGLAVEPDDDHSIEGRVYGSPLFISPEQALARPVSPASDLYGLGVTLYRAAAGRAPFYGERVDLLDAHVNEPPLRPSRHVPLSEGFDEVMLTALAKPPEQRWADGDAMAAALDAVEPTTEDPERPGKFGRLFRRR